MEFLSLFSLRNYLFSSIVLSQTINSESFIPEPLKNIGGGEGLTGIIQNILTIAFSLAGLIATVYIIWGGYQYITSGGGEGAENAKKTITNAIIGLVIIILSWALVNFVLGQLIAPEESTDLLPST